MRGELRQGHCLVGDLASILVNSVELAVETRVLERMDAFFDETDFPAWPRWRTPVRLFALPVKFPQQ